MVEPQYQRKYYKNASWPKRSRTALGYFPSIQPSPSKQQAAVNRKCRVALRIVHKAPYVRAKVLQVTFIGIRFTRP